MATDIEEDFDVLPVVDFKSTILDVVDSNQIVICIGETGSGKTTQIPQFLCDSNVLRGKMIAVTQPRRIAAITVAQRVSEERNTPLGGEVGYSIRFDDQTSKNTKIKYMTDGILVRECLFDKNLSKYSVVMLDEAHERSMHTDILFSLLKATCAVRPDLKLIVTSATLDSEKFSKYFNNCPIITVPGRIYPVDIYHSKIKQIMTVSGPATNSYVKAAVEVVMKIHHKDEDGHILVFLTGQEEIEMACSLIREALRAEQFDDRELIVLPLYAALSTDLQAKIFKKASVLSSLSPSEQKKLKFVRKCVVATNIAETSITVPHVRFVVDTGYVKQKAYDPSRSIESLIVVPISKIAAIQRAGRAGRTGPGQCYRLYSSDCFHSMMDETVPEIRRTNLANTVLYLKVLGIQDVLGFDFMDPPSEDQIVEALQQLHALGALDDRGYVTRLGELMSAFPLEPKLSRCVIESAFSACDCLREMLIIASMLSVDGVWYMPAQQERQQRAGGGGGQGGHFKSSSSSDALALESRVLRAEHAHAALRHPFGDHMSFLQVFEEWERAGFSLQWCEQHFIQYRSMKTARKTRDSLLDDMQKNDFQRKCAHLDRDHFYDPQRGKGEKDAPSLERRISNAIVAGYYMNGAVQCGNESVYKTLPVGNDASLSNEQLMRMVYVHPSSVYQFVRPAEYVVYQDLIFTSKLFMKQIAKVSRKCLTFHQGRWHSVSPLELSGREAKPPSPKKTETKQSMSDEPKIGQKRTILEVDQSAAMGQNSVDLARQRYLARKHGK